MLAALGPMSLRPILEALRGEPTADQTLSLLWSLGWLGGRHTTEDTLAELVLVRYLFDADPDIRDAASRALRLLPPQSARPWLVQRQREEPDPDVRRTIEEELDLIRGSPG
jgi:hypothetical protein